MSDRSALGHALAELTLRLCSIPSETGQEEAIAAEIHERCLRSGARVERIGNAVLAEGPPRPGRPIVALFGHSDTVRAAALQDLCIREGRVYGCGASDMKGGLAVMLRLLAEAAELLGAHLRCVFYDREEGPASESGLLPLCEEGRFDGVDLALCLEPTDNLLQAGCVGGLHARVTLPGQRAHSARPWQGRNAIYAALPYLTRLAGLARREVQIDGLRFYEVMNATQAHTDNSRNVVPDRFVLNVNYRFAPGKELDEAERELRALCPEDAIVEIIDRAPSGKVCLGHPLLRAWREEVGLGVEAKQAWTDVARLSARGIAAVNFGPGETAQAHQAQESIPIDSLVTHYEALRRLLLLPPPRSGS